MTSENQKKYNYPPGLNEAEKEMFAETAGKLEYDGGMNRKEAEKAALEHISSKRHDQYISTLDKEAEFQAARNILKFKNDVEYEDVFEFFRQNIKNAMPRIHINSFHPTELGQAEAAKLYLDDYIRYTDGTGWLAYDFLQGLYRADIAKHLLKDVLQILAQERYDLRNADNPKEYARYAEKAVTNYGIKQVMSLLESNLMALDSDFDKNYYFLNCKSWTVDLRTGSMGPSTPNHMHTKSTGYIPQEGDCPVFRKFLKEITLGDEELAAWLMRWFGYCLTGDTRAAYFVNFHGEGRNGKGTLLHVMRQIMGTYANELDQEVIVKNEKSNVKNALANLVGLRAGFASDISAGTLNLNTLKKITGGDELVAERKYQNSFPFRPIVKVTFSSNHIFRLSETDQAIRSRLRYVPFGYKAAGREDSTLEDRILKEGPEILSWLIREAVEYLKNPGPKGFPPCKIIDEATEDYIKSEDIIGQFLEECTVSNQFEEVRAGALYEEYKKWSQGKGDNKPMSNQAFGRRMSERGLNKGHSMTGTFYKGIRILRDYEQN